MMTENPQPRVLNRRRDGVPPGSVYIGRPSEWGNPFTIGRHGTRDEVIEEYERMVMADPAFQERIKRELRGKNLVCWCHPSPCHGDVLLRIANS